MSNPNVADAALRDTFMNTRISPEHVANLTQANWSRTTGLVSPNTHENSTPKSIKNASSLSFTKGMNDSKLGQTITNFSSIRYQDNGGLNPVSPFKRGLAREVHVKNETSLDRTSFGSQGPHTNPFTRKRHSYAGCDTFKAKPSL